MVVTARAPWSIEELAPAASDVAICCNGAVIWDLRRQQPLETYPLQPAIAGRIVTGLRERAPGVTFACELGVGAIREPAYVPLWPTPDVHPRRDALEIVAEPVFKLVAQHPDLSQHELHELTVELCGDEAARGGSPTCSRCSARSRSMRPVRLSLVRPSCGSPVPPAW